MCQSLRFCSKTMLINVNDNLRVVCEFVILKSMESYLNLWDIEKIARQYLGFNELLIKEYHARFYIYNYHNNTVCLKPTSETEYRSIVALQWRSITFVKQFEYIYTFKSFMCKRKRNASEVLRFQTVVSLPPVLFKENVYRASILR